MGLYDRLTFEKGLDTSFPAIDADPFDITWQTKSISRQHPSMANYKISSDGRLLREDAEYETVPEEERPRYNEEIGGFENEIGRTFGCMTKTHHDWIDVGYHGTFEFHKTIDGEYVSFDAKFTDGDLIEIKRSDRT